MKANSVRCALDVKLEAIRQYGEVCRCCGESWPIFLGIDHIDGGGTAHRKAVGQHTARWLKKNNYPPGYQVLCFNCNFAKHVKKVCPHQSTGGRNP